MTLKFRVPAEEAGTDGPSPAHAYLMGSDQHAIRAEISVESGVIVCRKRESGVAALALQWPVGKCGLLMVQTCLLPARPEPYLLNLELARYRLMLLYQKLEDWAMFDVAQDQPVMDMIDQSRQMFLDALSCQDDDPARADKLAWSCLVVAINAGEELSLVHADLLLAKRKAGTLPAHPVGCGLMMDQDIERLRGGLLANIDCYYLPTRWCDLAPEEGEYRWDAMDHWARWLGRNPTPVVAGPLVTLESHGVPDWLFIWEHEYETIRDLVYEHTLAVVSRYRNVITSWNAASGMHINSHFNFTFEQIMELSRMTTMAVKKAQPTARVLIEVCEPFGEYYATNQRSIPPLMYADLLVHGAVGFDGLVVKLLMGQSSPGHQARDLMQISHMLDRYRSLGKPVTLVVAVPSAPAPACSEQPLGGDLPEAQGDEEHQTPCGYWREPWSQLVQSRWLEAVFKIAISKPHVEAVAWYEWMDGAGIELPMSGLVGADFQPKRAFRKLSAFGKQLRTRPGDGALTAEGGEPDRASKPEGEQ